MDGGKPGGRRSKALSEGFYDALGHTIKVARTDLGIDRKDLAEMAGISYSYLAAIENGQKQPSSHVLLAVADALGLHTHQLLESAEGRRIRNLETTEDYPTWLSGSAPQAQAVRSAAAPAVAAPMADAFREPSPAPPPDLTDTDAYIEQLVGLAAAVPESDRQLLLDLARKLAGPL